MFAQTDAFQEDLSGYIDGYVSIFSITTALVNATVLNNQDKGKQFRRNLTQHRRTR